MELVGAVVAAAPPNMEEPAEAAAPPNTADPVEAAPPPKSDPPLGAVPKLLLDPKAEVDVAGDEKTPPPAGFPNTLEEEL